MDFVVGGIGTGGGSYDPGQSYARGEIVTLGGNTYIADDVKILDNRPVGLAITSLILVSMVGLC